MNKLFIDYPFAIYSKQEEVHIFLHSGCISRKRWIQPILLNTSFVVSMGDNDGCLFCDTIPFPIKIVVLLTFWRNEKEVKDKRVVEFGENTLRSENNILLERKTYWFNNIEETLDITKALSQKLFHRYAHLRLITFNELLHSLVHTLSR